MNYYNAETERSATLVGFGYAVYKCEEDGETVHAKRYGIVKSADDANAWLRGDDPTSIESLITAHPSEFITTDTVVLGISDTDG